MWLAAAEGRLKASEIAHRVKEFARDEWKAFGNYGPLSLDMNIGTEDGSLRLID